MVKTTTQPFAEGKTKRLFEGPERGTAIVEFKDDITGGDGRLHDVLWGKGAAACRTAVGAFSFLAACGHPALASAYLRQAGTTTMVAKRCEMVPLEVVVRREAHGSYRERFPHVPKAHIFPRLLVEFYLKTSKRRWEDHNLPVDDPLMVFQNGQVDLYHPHQPFHGQKPFLTLDGHPLSAQPDRYAHMGEVARRAFLALERAWSLRGGRLLDYKIEFGFTPDRELVIADDIEPGSWRVWKDGGYFDKQRYRDGEKGAPIIRLYQETAEIVSGFSVPKQQVLLWRGSDKDDLAPFRTALAVHLTDCPSVTVAEETRSAHKDAPGCLDALAKHLQDCPNTVVVALAGRSNGLGPMLAGHGTVPVITVPANYRNGSTNEVFSSLDAPNAVPVMTVVDPGNATLAALTVLAASNPALYSNLRYAQELRLSNQVPLA